MALVPLAVRIGPFPSAGVDASWTLAGSATLPVALLGASAALLFLSRFRELLEQLPPWTRWGAELGSLFLAPVALELCLGLGACVGTLGASDGLGTWALGALAISVHVALVSLIALGLRAPPALRIAATWALLWVTPTWLDASFLSGRWRILVDPSWHSEVFSDLGMSPLASAASVLALAGWLAAGAAVPHSRSA